MTQRLTGLDASFLYLETPSSHMHVAGLMILDPSDGRGRRSRSSGVKEVYGQRLHLAPPFRRRLAEVPFGLHHPLWIEDPDFDIDYHIRAHGAAGARRRTSSCRRSWAGSSAHPARPHPAAVGDLADRGPRGRQRRPCSSKVHHAAIDGASGNELTVALLDLTPEVARARARDGVGARPGADRRRAARLRGHVAGPPAVRVAKALGTHRRRGARRAPAQPASSRTCAAAVAVRRAPHVVQHRASPRAGASPSPRCRCPTVKAVKNAAGCHGQRRRARAVRRRAAPLPRRPAARRSTRRWWRWCRCRCAPRTRRTRWATGSARCSRSLATDVDDPVERLQVIHECMAEVKEQQKAIGADTLQRLGRVRGARGRRPGRPPLLAARRWPTGTARCSTSPSRTCPARRSRSTRPAPAWSPTTRSARSSTAAGLNMTVMSYLDQLDFGLLACPDVLPDIWPLADGLQVALDELVDAPRAWIRRTTPRAVRPELSPVTRPRCARRRAS